MLGRKRTECTKLLYQIGGLTLSIRLANRRAETSHKALDTRVLQQLDFKQPKRGYVMQFPLTLVSSCHMIDICWCVENYSCDSCTFGDTGHSFNCNSGFGKISPKLKRICLSECVKLQIFVHLSTKSRKKSHNASVK